MLSDYRATEFTHNDETKPVYVRGEGPAVIVIHEIPGITPKVTRFADWVVEAGFRVYMPLLVGEAGRDVSTGYILSSLAKVCISREFAVLAAHRSSPVTDWLRALARHASAETGDGPVGAVGMCFSGNFALSMMLEPCLMAPVLSQPSLPFPVGRARSAALHVSPEELRCVKERCAKGDKVLGLRFRGDPASPGARFETLRRELGAGFEAIELDDACANPNAPMSTPHSVLTEHLIDRDGEPTKEAARRVIAFFRERLTDGVGSRATAG
ncbi:MAG: dienelactone hydrolase family protein [Candidatus Binatia bacterium]